MRLLRSARNDQPCLANYFIKNNRLLRAERGNPVEVGGEAMKNLCVKLGYGFLTIILRD